MKKTYVMPHTEVMKMVTEQLLANSPGNPNLGLQDKYEGTLGPAGSREDDITPSRPNPWDQEW